MLSPSPQNRIPRDCAASLAHTLITPFRSAGLAVRMWRPTFRGRASGLGNAWGGSRRDRVWCSISTGRVISNPEQRRHGAGNLTRLAVRILKRLLVEERRRSFAIEQSERRGSPLNQEEFGLKRRRHCLNLGREVLSDLREMRIKDPNDCGWKLLEFV